MKPAVPAKDPDRPKASPPPVPAPGSVNISVLDATAPKFASKEANPPPEFVAMPTGAGPDDEAPKSESKDAKPPEFPSWTSNAPPPIPPGACPGGASKLANADDVDTDCPGCTAVFAAGCSSGGGGGADRHDAEPLGCDLRVEPNAPDAIAAFAALFIPFFSFFALRASYVSCMDCTNASSVTAPLPRVFLTKICSMSSRLIFAFERNSAASGSDTCWLLAPGRVP